MLFCLNASNALNKYLKADLPRLPHEPGKQAGIKIALTGNYRLLITAINLVKKQSLFVRPIAVLRFLYRLV